MQKINELFAAGRIIALAKYFEGSPEIIKYTNKATGQPAEMRQIKLAVSVTAGKSKKIVNGVVRVPDGEDPAKVLAAMNLQEGSLVVLDIDSLTKIAPATKGAESTWMLRLHAAYPLEEVQP